MRQIILDTETTGLHPNDGHRIVEVGCIELVNRKITGQRFHSYFNPERDSDPDALKVHGLETDFLNEQPLFSQVVEELLEFVRGAEILIHNFQHMLRVLWIRLRWPRANSQASVILLMRCASGLA
jgi:DNA polymerase III subunit epsilon